MMSSRSAVHLHVLVHAVVLVVAINGMAFLIARYGLIDWIDFIFPLGKLSKPPGGGRYGAIFRLMIPVMRMCHWIIRPYDFAHGSLFLCGVILIAEVVLAVILSWIVIGCIWPLTRLASQFRTPPASHREGLPDSDENPYKPPSV